MTDNEYSRMSLVQLLFTMFHPRVEPEDTQTQLERLYNRF